MLHWHCCTPLPSSFISSEMPGRQLRGGQKKLVLCQEEWSRRGTCWMPGASIQSVRAGLFFEAIQVSSWIWTILKIAVVFISPEKVHCWAEELTGWLVFFLASQVMFIIRDVAAIRSRCQTGRRENWQVFANVLHANPVPFFWIHFCKEANYFVGIHELIEHFLNSRWGNQGRVSLIFEGTRS